jgi:hypothetical protein
MRITSVSIATVMSAFLSKEQAMGSLAWQIAATTHAASGGASFPTSVEISSRLSTTPNDSLIEKNNAADGEQTPTLRGFPDRTIHRHFPSRKLPPRSSLD